MPGRGHYAIDVKRRVVGPSLPILLAVRFDDEGSARAWLADHPEHAKATIVDLRNLTQSPEGK